MPAKHILLKIAFFVAAIATSAIFTLITCLIVLLISYWSDMSEAATAMALISVATPAFGICITTFALAANLFLTKPPLESPLQTPQPPQAGPPAGTP
ncbi:hypothetical protein [Nonomuraea typhae]|uniref:Uncharacterized protein n=1 Tax=Nonomuraea typhae TaxID=2603600 RepID=A0ABW7Z8C4_9ACTN